VWVGIGNAESRICAVSMGSGMTDDQTDRRMGGQMKTDRDTMIGDCSVLVGAREDGDTGTVTGTRGGKLMGVDGVFPLLARGGGKADLGCCCCLLLLDWTGLGWAGNCCKEGRREGRANGGQNRQAASTNGTCELIRLDWQAAGHWHIKARVDEDYEL
jgi:hypothetical protein